jgi:hypothetical protein
MALNIALRFQLVRLALALLGCILTPDGFSRFVGWLKIIMALSKECSSILRTNKSYPNVGWVEGGRYNRSQLTWRV